jgi:hypothetical protein
LLFGASLWMATDHLLAVKSSRFRESYRRFYFRDIHAIIVTRCPRYPLSTRSAVLGFLLLVGVLFPATRWPSAALLAASIAAWLYISMRESCLCRIHTAVSCETLPSLYRIWNARRFLVEVEPLIAAAQANLPRLNVEQETGVPSAPSAASEPAEPLPGTSGAPDASAATAPARQRRARVSYCLLGAIVADSVYSAFDLTWPTPRFVWIAYIILALEFTTSIWAIVEHHRGRLAPAVQRVAIAVLVFTGAALYAQSIIATIDATVEQMREGKAKGSAVPPIQIARASLPFRRVTFGVGLVLDFVLAFVMFAPGAGGALVARAGAAGARISD